MSDPLAPTEAPTNTECNINEKVNAVKSHVIFFYVHIVTVKVLRSFLTAQQHAGNSCMHAVMQPVLASYAYQLGCRTVGSFLLPVLKCALFHEKLVNCIYLLALT